MEGKERVVGRSKTEQQKTPFKTKLINQIRDGYMKSYQQFV